MGRTRWIDSPRTPTYNGHAMPQTEGRRFLKMHGLGNDFVVVDARERAFVPSAGQARRIADRHRGVGFDQLIVIEPARQGAVARLRFWNADGSESGACGTRPACSRSPELKPRRTFICRGRNARCVRA